MIIRISQSGFEDLLIPSPQIEKGQLLVHVPNLLFSLLSFSHVHFVSLNFSPFFFFLLVFWGLGRG